MSSWKYEFYLLILTISLNKIRIFARSCNILSVSVYFSLYAKIKNARSD